MSGAARCVPADVVVADATSRPSVRRRPADRGGGARYCSSPRQGGGSRPANGGDTSGKDTMTQAHDYVLGQSARAARRLEIQDAHFDEVSERLLDELALRPDDRVVELGCGPGGFSRRVLRRLGDGGVLVGVDSSAGLLDQARTLLNGIGPARFEPMLADVAELGPWL